MRLVDDSQLRSEIFAAFAESGRAPAMTLVAQWAGGPSEAEAALRRLHDAHALVLDDSGDIRMALPFSAVETDHRVVADGRSWWANCAWDALAIPAALDIDARIEARWIDTGDAVELDIVDGRPSSYEGFVHFAIPARFWWDDIVET
jgi:hypothetical protein